MTITSSEWLSGAVERPWAEPIGMTTSGWISIPPRSVQIATLTPTQAHADRGRDPVRPWFPWSGDYFPHAIKHDDALYVCDGHSRICALLAHGETSALVRIHRLSDPHADGADRDAA